MTDVEVYQPGAVAPRQEFDSSELQLLRDTVAKGATENEFKLFVAQCTRTGLDPFARQIHFSKRGQGSNARVTIITGIDGLCLIADRTGRFAGFDGPWWCGADGQWREVWLEKDSPAAAKVIVRKLLRDGTIGTFPAVAHWSEYEVTGDQGFMWRKMPAGQLAKCAKALALRSAFPADMSGLYGEDEMAQADNPPPRRGTPEPFPDNGRVSTAEEAKANIAEAKANLRRRPPQRSGAESAGAEATSPAPADSPLDGLRQLVKDVASELDIKAKPLVEAIVDRVMGGKTRDAHALSKADIAAAVSLLNDVRVGKVIITYNEDESYGLADGGEPFSE